MRRIVVAGLITVAALVALFYYPTSRNESLGRKGDGRAGAGGSAPSAASTSAPSGSASSASTYDGKEVTTRHGTVQVQVTVASGKIASVRALRYPDGDHHDREINEYAIPILNSEAVKAQSADIDAVSGATVTSQGYVESLQSALDAANL